MKPKTKLIVIFLFFLVGVFVVYYFSKQSPSFYFDFGRVEKIKNDVELEKIINKNIGEIKGHFAIYIEELETSPSAKLTPDESKPTSGEVLPLRKYVLNEKEVFPSASLYKLVLIGAVMKEVEAGSFKLNDIIYGSKSDLTNKFRSLDFGYEDMPEKFSFTIEEALERVGRISDNFAAIMLTDRLRQVPQKEGEEGLLIKMAKEIGMKNTDFMADPVSTTASDMGIFFKALYLDQIISPQASAEIKKILELNQINNRIPAQLPEDVKVIHKTGELAGLRHDTGIVFASRPYLIVLLSKDLQYEDDGVETLANISKGVFDYFSRGD